MTFPVTTYQASGIGLLAGLVPSCRHPSATARRLGVKLDIIRRGFFKRGLCGQTDAAKHELEARIRTQAIKQQVRLEAQSKI
jgi:hypothetical protein